MVNEKKRFTRTEIIKIIYDASIRYYEMYGSEMSLSEQLFFADIHETIENMVNYELEKLENDDAK